MNDTLQPVWYDWSYLPQSLAYYYPSQLWLWIISISNIAFQLMSIVHVSSITITIANMQLIWSNLCYGSRSQSGIGDLSVLIWTILVSITHICWAQESGNSTVLVAWDINCSAVVCWFAILQRRTGILQLNWLNVESRQRRFLLYCNNTLVERNRRAKKIDSCRVRTYALHYVTVFYRVPLCMGVFESCGR